MRRGSKGVSHRHLESYELTRLIAALCLSRHGTVIRTRSNKNSENLGATVEIE
jgi:hypothetical protein